MRNKYWYNKLPFLNAMQFSIANGIPIPEAIVDFPIPAAAKVRLLETLRSGTPLREALKEAGVPSKEASLLDVNGGASGASLLLDLSVQSAFMSAKWKSLFAEAFAYPNTIALISILCCLFLTSVGIAFQQTLWYILFPLFLLLLIVIQSCVFFSWERIPILARIKTLESARILFLYLQFCFSQRMDESASVKAAMDELGLQRATGCDAWNQLRSGLPFLAALAGMPAVKTLRFGIPATDQIDRLLDVLARKAEQEWNTDVHKLLLFLKTSAILLSGGAVLVLAISVFLSIYATGVE